MSAFPKRQPWAGEFTPVFVKASAGGLSELAKNHATAAKWIRSRGLTGKVGVCFSAGGKTWVKTFEHAEDALQYLQEGVNAGNALAEGGTPYVSESGVLRPYELLLGREVKSTENVAVTLRAHNLNIRAMVGAGVA